MPRARGPDPVREGITEGFLEEVALREDLKDVLGRAKRGDFRRCSKGLEGRLSLPWAIGGHMRDAGGTREEAKMGPQLRQSHGGDRWERGFGKRADRT